MKLSDAIRPHIGGLNEIITGGFTDYGEKYKDTTHIHDSSCRSKIRSCHMFARAARYAAAHSGDVQVFEVKRLRGILIAQYVSVIFKKFNDDLISMNNHTPQSRAYRNQRPIAGIRALVYLIAGYQQNEETGELTGTFLTRPSGKQTNAWEWRLDDQIGKPVVMPLFAPEEEEQEADIRRRSEPAEVIPLPRKKDDNDKP